jgi:hypothetical protein
MTTALGNTSKRRVVQGPLMLRPIDRLHLAKQSLGDPGLELEILRTFGEVVERHFGRLQQAGSVSEMLCQLQTLKTASVGVGAWSLAEHAHIIEGEIRAGEPFNGERVEDLSFCIAELRGFIAEQIAADEG